MLVIYFLLVQEKGETDIGYIGDKSVDEILQIINSNKLAEINPAPAKAAKKARQKQRKMVYFLIYF